MMQRRLITPAALYKMRRSAEHVYAIHKDNLLSKRATVLIRQEIAQELGLLKELHDVGLVAAERDHRCDFQRELGIEPLFRDTPKLRHVKPDYVMAKIPLLEYVEALRRYEPVPTNPQQIRWTSR